MAEKPRNQPTQLFVNIVPTVTGVDVFYNCSDEQMKYVLERWTRFYWFPTDEQKERIRLFNAKYYPVPISTGDNL